MSNRESGKRVPDGDAHAVRGRVVCWRNFRRATPTFNGGLFPGCVSGNNALIRGSSRDAGWTHGTVVIHRKVGDVDWEKSLGGWVKTPQGVKPLLVGETCQNGDRNPTHERPIILTPALLRQYGIPVRGN